MTLVAATAPARRWPSRLWPRRIGRRLALGFGALVLLMLLALWYVEVPLYLLARANQRFTTSDMPRLLRVQALSLQTEGVGSALIRLMNAPRDNRVTEYADVDERNRRIDGIIESLVTELRDLEQEETLKRLVACRAVYAEAFIATVDEIEAGDLAAAARVLNQRVNPALKALLLESGNLLQRERQRIETQLTSYQQMLRQFTVWAAVATLLAVLLALLLAWRTTRSVVRPLARLEAAAQRIAAGDYGSAVLDTGTEEVDRVGQALTSMTAAIAAREHEIERLAFRDPLTDLPNRTFLLTSAAAQQGDNNCLLLLDLARLKTINETLGFVTGDTLIKEVAQRCQSVLQQASAAGLLVHLSAGRFAVLMQASSRAAVETLRSQLEQAMAQPVLCSGHSVDLSLAYGLADSANEASPRPVTTLVRNAEVALHVAKRAALGFAWYSEAQEAARLSHLSLVSDLRVAVTQSQLQMWLQPKFSLKTGQAVGAEALVRWQHPQRGFISPAEFVPFAEQTGYIGMVTRWMLEQALTTLAQWAPRQPDLSISVNLSTRDLQDPQLYQRVAQLIAQHAVDPQCLRLEIVESGLMQDASSSVALLQRLRQIGCRLSIDDFGTGYSSLAYLQQLPVDELKIDRSFVDRVDALSGTQRLVKTMIEMGHGLGLLVTAEGVETLAEKQTLIGLDCDVMQGYLASRPLHGAALQAWFDALPTPTAPGTL